MKKSKTVTVGISTIVVPACIPSVLTANAPVINRRFKRSRSGRHKLASRDDLYVGYIGWYRYFGLLVPYEWSPREGLWFLKDTSDLDFSGSTGDHRIPISFNSEHTASSPGLLEH